MPMPPPTGVPSELLMDANAINQAASANPHGVAQALVAAVRANPTLESAVMEAFTAAEDE